MDFHQTGPKSANNMNFEDPRATLQSSALTPRKRGLLDAVVTRFKESRRGYPERYEAAMLRTDSSAAVDADSEVCAIDHSPKRMFKLATSDNAEQFEHILNKQPSLLRIKDDTGKSLLHIAAENGKPLLIDLLVNKGLPVDIKDDEGETSLHVAAMTNNVKAVEALIALNADLYAKNAMLETPLHEAVRFDSLDALEALLRAGTRNINIAGWHGRAPLHLAAVLDYLDCFKLLVAHGANVNFGCFSKLTAVHAAASRGSKKVLKYLLTEYKGEEAFNQVDLTDLENQTALHWAVNNGNCETIKILLEHGAALDAQMYDKSTPVHLACAQGLLNALIEMDNSSSVSFQSVLFKKDTQGMTPLHRAVMFNHTAVVNFLIQKGALLDDEDSEGRTALILAASRGSWTSLELLLKAGAGPLKCDKRGKNFMHYSIMHGGAPTTTEELVGNKKTICDLLANKDTFGCTPLHYAAKIGSLRCSDGLMRLGACINAKDKQQQSPLHFAAKYGRYNTVKRLLETSHGYNIINESDNLGLTPLHVAAMNGHTRVVKLLMSKGALIHRNNAGESPLHLACIGDYRETVQVIVVHYSHLIDSVDKNGNTGLHKAAEHNATKVIEDLLTAGAKILLNEGSQTPMDVAVQKKHQEAATCFVLHKRWIEILITPSATYGWPVLGLIEHLPEVMAAALDRSLTKSEHHPWSKNFFIHFDFVLLEPPGVEHMDDINAADPKSPLKALNAMVRHGRSELLSHPVCTSYLNKKWASYGAWIHGFNVLIYGTFLLLLTYLVSTGIENELMPRLKHQSYSNVHNNTPAEKSGTFDMADPRFRRWMVHGKESMMSAAASILICVFTIINMLKELVQLCVQGKKYFLDYSNYVEWFLYIFATIFAFAGCDKSEEWIIWTVRWQLGAAAIFLAWFNIMLYLQRFGTIGVYVVMFLQILRSLLRAIFVFTFLLLGFVFAFQILLPTFIFPDDADFYLKPGLVIDVRTLATPHAKFGYSALRVINMLLGEIDAVTNYITPMQEGTVQFPHLTGVFVVVFIILSVLVMNLLIGLAVGDIESVQRSATLQRMAMQVDLHTGLEKNLPKWFIKRVTFKEDTYYPNGCTKGLLKKFVCITGNNPVANYSGFDTPTPSEKRMQCEMDKQRRKLRDVHGKLDQQSNLLRLIIQKMEIHDEAEQLDERVNDLPPPYKK